MTKLYGANAKLLNVEKKSKAIRRILVEVETDTLIKGEEGLEKGRKCKADLVALRQEESRYWWMRVRHGCDAIFAGPSITAVHFFAEMIDSI